MAKGTACPANSPANVRPVSRAPRSPRLLWATFQQPSGGSGLRCADMPRKLCTEELREAPGPVPVGTLSGTPRARARRPRELSKFTTASPRLAAPVTQAGRARPSTTGTQPTARWGAAKWVPRKRSWLFYTEKSIVERLEKPSRPGLDGTEPPLIQGRAPGWSEAGTLTSLYPAWFTAASVVLTSSPLVPCRSHSQPSPLWPSPPLSKVPGQTPGRVWDWIPVLFPPAD